jgi:uncharacterized protein
MTGGCFGVGGGAVLIPLLTSRFKLTQHQAHGTSLAVIGATSVASVVVYALHGRVAWLAAVIIGIVSALSARYGARFAARTSPGGLRRAFAVLLVLLAAKMLWGSPAATHAVVHGTPGSIAFMAGLGIPVGLLSGYMGVGGGVLIVPGLTMLLGWEQHLAQGTSLAAILVVAPAGAVEHARLGNVVGRLVPALAIGAAIGAPLGSWLVQGLDRVLLGRCFAVFLLATAAITWTKTGRKGAGSAGPTPLATRS